MAPLPDYYCCQFQPNPFDPSRCGSCLRPHHMHIDGTIAAAPRQQDADDDDDDDDDNDVGDDDLDDDPALSEGTTSDDLSRLWTYEWTLVHCLSPNRELNICNADTESSSPNHQARRWRSVSLSSERRSEPQRDMTRLDSSPHSESSWMDEKRGRDRTRQASESRGDRKQESGYFSPGRRANSEQQIEEVNKRPFRYYERGHPLPSNIIPEPKACVPYRNVNLGVPSQRRSTETYVQETWRSESPQRYTYHSNFRRGTESQSNSPTRHSSVSPNSQDRYKFTDSPLGTQRRSSISRNQSHASSHWTPSHSPLQTSGRTSPSRRRGSAVSRVVSPSRISPSNRTTDSFYLQNGEFDAQKAVSRASRRPSQASNKHSLDSEKLYKNLESISHHDFSENSYEGCQGSPRSGTAVNSSTNTHARNSRNGSPSRNGYDTYIHTPQREAYTKGNRLSPSQGSWQGSSHSILSLPPSRGSSMSRRGMESQVLGGAMSHVTTMETDRGSDGNNDISCDRSRSIQRRGMDALLTSESKKNSADVEEVFMTMEDYIVLADIPKIHLEPEEEYPGLRRRNQSPSPCRDQRLRTYRYQDETDVSSSRFESDERGRGRERGRDRREKCRDAESGRLSRRQSTASLHTQSSDSQSGKDRSSKVKGNAPSEHSRAQGWISRLDEDGNWEKHWFVLADTSLRYYRDSEADESDDLDGEIDLTSCVNVSDCDVEKNYGFQIQTKRAVFTLSAMTSRIRRNWVKLLKQAIQNSTYQSDTGSEKVNPHSWRPSSCQPLTHFNCKDSGYETTPASTKSATAATNSHCRSASADPDLDARTSDLSPASQREEGEGWDREQAKRLEERNKWFEEGIPFSEMSSRWDSMELKSGSVPMPVTGSVDSEVSRKWAEFERLSFRDMTAQSLIGTQAYHSNNPQVPQSSVSNQTNQSSPEEADHSATPSQTDVSNSNVPLLSVNGSQIVQSHTAEALQKEALSLRKQVESIKKERAAMGIEVDSPCGPRAPCKAKLEALEVAHQKSLQELQDKHAREIRELEKKRDKMLQEESQAAAKAVEALKAAHREELEKMRRLTGGAAQADALQRRPQADALHSELDSLSERYSQTCLELSRTEQSSVSRRSELGRKEREVEQLQRENHELKARLAEEVSRMRYFITGQRSDVVSPENTERPASQLETLLRAKEHEVQYLKKEISCLQSEVQSLTKEKQAAYERYKEAYVELSDVKSRSQLESGSLNEHLRLTNAALQESARKT